MKLNKIYLDYLRTGMAWEKRKKAGGDHTPEAESLKDDFIIRQTFLPAELNLRAGRYLFNRLLNGIYKDAIESGALDTPKPPRIRTNEDFEQTLQSLADLGVNPATFRREGKEAA